MTLIIKKVTIQEIKNLQQNLKEDFVVDIPQFTASLQSSIIVNCSVGTGYAKQLVEVENDDGSISQISLQESMTRIQKFCFKRGLLPLNLMFPELRPYHIQLNDRRYARNCDRFNNFIQKIIDERRQGKSKSYDDSSDLLSILIDS